MLREFKKRNGAGHSVHNENRGLPVASLHLNKGRESRKGGLLQQGSQGRDSLSMIDRGTGELTSEFLRDCGKEQVCRLKTASDTEEIIVDPNRWPLQNTLPNLG